jgi:TatD DNase family protein
METGKMAKMPAGAYPTLDAHAHLSPDQPARELAEAGVVLAMSLSLEQAEAGLAHAGPNIAWGIGCHPRSRPAQASFDPGRFVDLLEKSAIVGEIGLDAGARLPLETQLKNFRQVLEAVSTRARIVSIHSHRATGLVLKELQRCPVRGPILHWWTGSLEETAQAVELGCYFSIHSAVARHTKFRKLVPPERILVESDQGYQDPPAAIPGRIEQVENLVARQYGMEAGEIRRLVWQNFAELARQTAAWERLPGSFQALLDGLREPGPAQA